MIRDKRPHVPDWASPPGDTLEELLEEKSMTQTELADRLGVSLKHVNRIVKGAASISPELSLGLEKVFGAPASFWMTREAHYQADRARQAQRSDLVHEVDWANCFPLKELRERGVISRTAQGAELVEELLGFLGIAQPSQWRPPQVAYRKSAKFASDPFALSAWLREGELDSGDIDVSPYDEARFLDALQRARSLTLSQPEKWWPELQSVCADAGVAVVVVEPYKKARANGAARWLSADQALIQLTLRHSWEDIFWFSFFHEAGHIVLHRKKERFEDMFVETTGQRVGALEQKLEREADHFASRTLIPSPHDRRLHTLSLSEVPSFARLLGVAPAIIVGRLQHDQLLPFSRGNEYRRRLTYSR